MNDVLHLAARRGWHIVVFSIAFAQLGTSCATAVDLIGYLPYYRMNASYNANVLPDQLAMLDEVRYFGLSVDNVGGIASLSGSINSHKNNIATIKGIIEGLPAADQPRLNVTLGGASQDATFTAVAASASLRTTLAVNVDSLLDETGATSVDIDWEHPDAGVQRTTHYPALLKRIKEEVGENRLVNATVAPSVVVSNSIFSGTDAIDGVSLMTYDLGWWGNDPGNPNDGEHSLPEYTEDAVDAWTDAPGSPNQRPWVFGTWGNSAPADMLGVGLPFYGRNVSNGTAYTYSELANGGTTTDGNYYTYLGQTVWVPGPDLVEQRVEFAHDQGLRNIIIWEIGQDLPTSDPDSLLRRAFETKQGLVPIPGDYDGDDTVGESDYVLWKSTFGSTTGGDLRADGNGDSIVNAADYTIWRDNLPLAGVGALTGLPVPEPSTGWMLATILGGLFVFRSVNR